jgi:hypothetical protein
MTYRRPFLTATVVLAALIGVLFSHSAVAWIHGVSGIAANVLTDASSTPITDASGSYLTSS